MYNITVDENIFKVLPIAGTERYDVFQLDGRAIATIWPVLGRTSIEWLCDNENLQNIIDKIGNAVELIER
ncbi:MAG: hypothetical protein EOO92_07480 [Pedobacter sp.]|nr:MAG: hypothetical protein EOO92_07480 [Pedobacter sp.]